MPDSILSFIGSITNLSKEPLGSGVLVTPTHLVTCKHVVKTLGRVEVTIDGKTCRSTKIHTDPDNDLALIELDTHMGTPPQWSCEDPTHAEIHLYGFQQGQARNISGKAIATVRAPGQQFTQIDVQCSARFGLSGGVGIRQVDFASRCVGITTMGGDESYKSILIGGSVVAGFLATHGIQLPGWPDMGCGNEPAAFDPAHYLHKLREDTRYIDIRGFQVGDGKAKRFEIDTLYIAPRSQSMKGDAPLEALVEKSRCVVIQGDAGSGKSTLLQHLAYRFSDGKTYLPLKLQVAMLGTFIEKSRKLPGTPASEEDPRWLAHLLADNHPELPLDYLYRQLHQPNTLILLDGLDEAPNATRRRILANLFGNAARTYKKCRFVLTTRPGAFLGDEKPHEFTTESIAPLNDREVATFVGNWSRCLFPENAEAAEKHRKDLATQVNATQQVREMAANPMMLTALAAIHWNEKRLPDDRAELYESILQWLIRSREKREGRRNAKECEAWLRTLAYGMQTWPEGRLKQASHEIACEILVKGLNIKPGEAANFLEQEQLDSGIIVSRQDSVEFKHLTFQEYLAARELLDNYSDSEQQKLLQSEQRFSVEWREFLKLLALAAKPRKAAWLYERLLDGAKPEGSLAAKARTIAIVTTLADDRKDRTIADERYNRYVLEMPGLFAGKADGQGLDMWSRAKAAEAWERLGDHSRLPLPHEERYWWRVGNFDIARYPVTAYEYARFVQAGGPAPAWEEAYPQRPVVTLNWHEACQYCEWVSQQTGRKIRLPKDEEWIQVAPPKEYPWGDDEAGDDHANFDMRVGTTTPVGLFPAGAPQGAPVYDLAGNVWEWGLSDYDKLDKVLRGGAYFLEAVDLRCASRVRVVPGFRHNGFGFRCVREVSP